MFEATIKPLHRGGWSARVVMTSVAAGQVRETQIGPRAFEQRQKGVDWLNAVAAEQGVAKPRIFAVPPQR